MENLSVHPVDNHSEPSVPHDCEEVPLEMLDYGSTPYEVGESSFEHAGPHCLVPYAYGTE